MKRLNATRRITGAGRVFVYLQPANDFYPWLAKIMTIVAIIEAYALIHW